MDNGTKTGLIPKETIDLAAAILLKTAPHGSEVILFGSYARGDADEQSDLDFMVVEPAVHGRRAEMVRLRSALKPLQIPVDVIVVSRELFNAWKGKINNVVHEAATEGKTLCRLIPTTFLWIKELGMNSTDQTRCTWPTSLSHGRFG